MAITNPVSDFTNLEVARLGVLSLDQSTEKIGHSTWVGGTLESYGLFEPDWPRLNDTRSFVKDYLVQFASEGLTPVLVCEDIYYSKNIVTYRALATLMGHLQAACFDCGGLFDIVTANDALLTLTGIKASPRNPVPRAERKKLIITEASRIAGDLLQEDVADSVAIGWCFLKRNEKQAIPF